MCKSYLLKSNLLYTDINFVFTVALCYLLSADSVQVSHHPPLLPPIEIGSI